MKMQSGGNYSYFSSSSAGSESSSLLGLTIYSASMNPLDAFQIARSLQWSNERI